MNGIDRLSKALRLLNSLGNCSDIQLIGELGWSSIPESYKIVESWVLKRHRIVFYKLKDNVVVKISDVGIFQIM